MFKILLALEEIFFRRTLGTYFSVSPHFTDALYITNEISVRLCRQKMD